MRAGEGYRSGGNRAQYYFAVTESRALERAVQESREVIQAVLTGARDRRIATEGKSGNLQLLAEGINELIGNVSMTVAETVQLVRCAVDGDLTSRMQVDNKSGEFKALATSVNSMIQAMMEVVTSLTNTCRAVQLGAEEISRGNRDLSKRTDEQASSLLETTSSMNRMTSTVKNNANSATQANQLALAAREEAERGGAVVSAAVAAMSEINTASNKIAEITSMIDEIAFQTNLSGAERGGGGRAGWRSGQRFRGGGLRGAQSRIEERGGGQGDQSADCGCRREGD